MAAMPSDVAYAVLTPSVILGFVGLCFVSGAQLQSSVERPCPGERVTFTCTVSSVGHQWDIPFLNISRSLLPNDQGRVITDHPQFQFSVTAVMTGSITSTATVTATIDLNNTLVACQDGIGMLPDQNNIIKIMGPPSAPTLSCVDLSRDVSGAVNVTVSWTLSGGDSADFYLISITTNAPQTPFGGLLNITTASVAQYELTGFMAGYEYNITVRGVNCGSQEGRESEPLTITPQVPDTPSYCTSAVRYNQSSAMLLSIESIWNTVEDPADPCSGITGNITKYQIEVQTRSVVDTESVNVASCTAGKCSHTFEPPSNPPSSYDSVSVAAENVVGVGAARTCTTQTINTTNNLLTRVRVIVSSPDIGVLFCKFLSGFTGSAHCTVQYGTDPTYKNLPYSAESTKTGTAGDSVSVVLRERLNSSTVYYYTVSAVSGDITVRVLGSFTTPQYYCSPRQLWNLPATGFNFLTDVSLLDNAVQYQSCDVGSVGSAVLNDTRFNTATVAYYSGNTPGSSACFVCNNDSEYELNTTMSVRFCRSNGTWSKSAITCVSRQPPVESPRQLDIWPILIMMGVMALELISVTGTVIFWDRKDKLKWWKTALLVIGALAVVPGIVLIIIWIVISCFRKVTIKWWPIAIATIVSVVGVALVVVGAILSNPEVGSAVEPVTTDVTMWIAVSTTAVGVFIAGLLAGFLIYHCIIKHKSQSSKPDPSSQQQQQTPSSSNPLQQTSPEYAEVVKLKPNKAYELTRTGIEMRANEAYQPKQ